MSADVKPETETARQFMGTLYFAPKTANQIAFARDLGTNKNDILKKLTYAGDDAFTKNLNESLREFIEYYTANLDRAKELMMPYSEANFWNFER